MTHLGSENQWRRVAWWVVGLAGASLVHGCGTEPGVIPALVRTFDAVCVSTRLDEDVFHAQIGMLVDAKEVPADFLYALSPNNVAGYYFTDQEGSRVFAVMGLTSIGGVESRSCSLMSRDITFGSATALVADHFPVKIVDQFTQGAGQFAVFQGILAGYSGEMGISVQGGEGVTTVSIFELPEA